MDTEILSSLSEVKALLIAILVIVTVLLLGQIAKLISRLVKKRIIYRERAFVTLAARDYDNQKFEELVKYCEEKLKAWGDNPYPLYWLARAKFKLGDLELAKKLFEKVKDMEPEWQSTVEPHIVKINKVQTRHSS